MLSDITHLLLLLPSRLSVVSGTSANSLVLSPCLTTSRRIPSLLHWIRECSLSTCQRQSRHPSPSPRRLLSLGHEQLGRHAGVWYVLAANVPKTACLLSWHLRPSPKGSLSREHKQLGRHCMACAVRMRVCCMLQMYRT